MKTKVFSESYFGALHKPFHNCLGYKFNQYLKTK